MTCATSHASTRATTVVPIATANDIASDGVAIGGWRRSTQDRPASSVGIRPRLFNGGSGISELTDFILARTQDESDRVLLRWR